MKDKSNYRYYNQRGIRELLLNLNVNCFNVSIKLIMTLKINILVY